MNFFDILKAELILLWLFLLLIFLISSSLSLSLLNVINNPDKWLFAVFANKSVFDEISPSFLFNSLLNDGIFFSVLIL